MAGVVFLLYFFGLGRVGLLGPDEPRYAQVAREMLRSGDYVTPHLNGRPWFEKPPLYYWLAAGSFRLFGVNEWAARLPAALAAAGFLALFGWIARRLYPGQTYCYALMVLAASAGWLGFARAASPEMFFTAALAGALGVLGLWVWHGEYRLLYASYALLAVAVLAKGPTAVLLAALVLAAYCVSVRDFRWLLRVLAPGPLLVFAAIAVPWYAAVYVRNGDTFVEEFIYRQHFRRFATEELAHPGPWWYYAPVLLGLVFPWTPHLALIVADLASRGRAGLMKDPRRLYLLAWVVPIVIFFSLSKGKLPGYVLVTVPALALWMGDELARAPAARVRWVFVAQALLLPMLLVLVNVLPAALAQGLRSAGAALGEARLDRPLAVLLLAGTPLLLLAAWRKRRLAASVLATALAALAVARLIAVVAPAVDRLASARPLAQEIASRGISPSQLALAPGVRRHIEYGLAFYLGQPVPRGVPAPFIVLPDGRVERSEERR